MKKHFFSIILILSILSCTPLSQLRSRDNSLFYIELTFPEAEQINNRSRSLFSESLKITVLIEQRGHDSITESFSRTINQNTMLLGLKQAPQIGKCRIKISAYYKDTLFPLSEIDRNIEIHSGLNRFNFTLEPQDLDLKVRLVTKESNSNIDMSSYSIRFIKISDFMLHSNNEAQQDSPFPNFSIEETPSISLIKIESSPSFALFKIPPSLISNIPIGENFLLEVLDNENSLVQFTFTNKFQFLESENLELSLDLAETTKNIPFELYTKGSPLNLKNITITSISPEDEVSENSQNFTTDNFGRVSLPIPVSAKTLSIPQWNLNLGLSALPPWIFYGRLNYLAQPLYLYSLLNNSEIFPGDQFAKIETLSLVGQGDIHYVPQGVPNSSQDNPLSKVNCYTIYQNNLYLVKKEDYTPSIVIEKWNIQEGGISLIKSINGEASNESFFHQMAIFQNTLFLASDQGLTQYNLNLEEQSPSSSLNHGVLGLVVKNNKLYALVKENQDQSVAYQIYKRIDNDSWILIKDNLNIENNEDYPYSAHGLFLLDDKIATFTQGGAHINQVQLIDNNWNIESPLPLSQEEAVIPLSTTFDKKKIFYITRDLENENYLYSLDKNGESTNILRLYSSSSDYSYPSTEAPSNYYTSHYTDF